MEINRFLFWGMFGLSVEICFTAIISLFTKKKINLIGHTSLWMFPIYSLGLTFGFDLIKQIIPITIIRYLSYPLWIWGIEILIGYPASKMGVRIWDYSYLPDSKHWKGVISYVHFPVWIFFGILVEIVGKRLY